MAPSSRMLLVATLLLFTTLSTRAWVVPSNRQSLASMKTCSSSRLFSSTPPENQEQLDKEQVDREINQEIELSNISFDEAGKGLIEEEDAVRLEESGDFDTNPAYKSDNIDAMREAIRKRTEEMGLEKSVLSKQVIQEANERARAGENVQGLDLSKIRGNIPDNMPSMLYDPEDEMTEEEKEEVDPVGQMNIVDQAKNELTNAKWPGAGAVLREVAIMIGVVAFTAVLIIFWDKFLREFYTNDLNLIPSKEQINMRFEGLELPDGWTNMMSEDDIANLPSGLRDTASSSATTSSSGGGVSLPDL